MLRWFIGVEPSLKRGPVGRRHTCAGVWSLLPPVRHLSSGSRESDVEKDKDNRTASVTKPFPDRGCVLPARQADGQVNGTEDDSCCGPGKPNRRACGQIPKVAGAGIKQSEQEGGKDDTQPKHEGNTLPTGETTKEVLYAFRLRANEGDQEDASERHGYE